MAGLSKPAVQRPTGKWAGRGGGEGGAYFGIFVCLFIKGMSTVSSNPVKALRFRCGAVSDCLNPIGLADGTAPADSRRNSPLAVQPQSFPFSREVGP